ncbi:RanGTP-binding protein-domain-containing protein [Chaetomium strumarium]|uniref:RanGTP-binding protein-domain-containing protein n=1 Tax=Chaetomium strumarium TaxID=1170767 RepID=A0AAJ0GNN8_9PEZI|nr:RanGTP-binding protein-domain-containing protein [Chaetomium strumarium]
MDALLQTLGAQTFNYAIRTGIALTSRYAVQQCSRLVKSVNDKAVRAELKELQKLLDSKIKILSPALDLIEFKSGRGNVFLESAVPLAKSLRREIASLGKRLENAAIAEEDAVDGARRARMSEARHAELLLIIRHIKDLLGRIDRDIPLLQLAITASGEKMSTRMTPGISPSRMMQASALLSFADAHFVMDPSRPMQIGPSFTLSLYMLFLGHSQARPGAGARDRSLLTPAGSEGDVPADNPYGLGEGERKPIWQEVMHKSRVRLCRTPVNWVFDPTQGYQPSGADGTQPPGSVPLFEPSDGYAYHLEIIEDLDDGRLHDGDEFKPRPFDDVTMAGIRESIPIHQISKIFYTDTGRILNIGNNDERDNNPVLLLKRDINAKSPITMRQEWFGEPEGEEEEQQEGEAVNVSQPDTVDESSGSDQQDDVDRQLWQETEHATKSPRSQDGQQKSQLPPHLDPEWLALEVYTEDNSEDDEDEDEAGLDDPSTQGSPRRALIGSPPMARNKLSVDSKLVAQMRHISLRVGSPPLELDNQASADLLRSQEEAAKSYVRRSPFGSIASSLSLLEMVIRLTSLQEFQQTSHLAIPDHILMFFLEETSTTGLQGEEHWRMRREAKRRMGFDPYNDGLAREDHELSR